MLAADPMLSRLLAISQVASQPTLTRFFSLFRHAGINQGVFTPLYNWAMMRLPSLHGGYSLDLDSTRLLHEDGHQEGVSVGYTRLGNKPCLHPLLAVLEEPKLVVGFWLRSGNSSCANNIIAFTLELLQNLPKHVRLRLVRADSGFCNAPWLSLLESQHLKYIVVARLLAPLQRLCKKETIWQPTELIGTEVAQVWHQEHGWQKARPLILIRQKVADKKRPGGKKLLIGSPTTTPRNCVNFSPKIRRLRKSDPAQSGSGVKISHGVTGYGGRLYPGNLGAVNAVRAIAFK